MLRYWDTLMYIQRQQFADISPIGLLVQTENGESRVICYASSSPSDVERRYL